MRFNGAGKISRALARTSELQWRIRGLRHGASRNDGVRKR